jgi:hypothetical protein
MGQSYSNIIFSGSEHLHKRRRSKLLLSLNCRILASLNVSPSLSHICRILCIIIHTFNNSWLDVTHWTVTRFTYTSFHTDVISTELNFQSSGVLRNDVCCSQRHKLFLSHCSDLMDRLTKFMFGWQGTWSL